MAGRRCLLVIPQRSVRELSSCRWLHIPSLFDTVRLASLRRSCVTCLVLLLPFTIAAAALLGQNYVEARRVRA